MKKKSRAEEYGVSEYTYKKYLEKYDEDAPGNIIKMKQAKAVKRKA